MKRSAIIVIVLLAFGVLVTPLSTNAQRPGKLPRIGYLGDSRAARRGVAPGAA